MIRLPEVANRGPEPVATGSVGNSEHQSMLREHQRAQAARRDRIRRFMQQRESLSTRADSGSANHPPQTVPNPTTASQFEPPAPPPEVLADSIFVSVPSYRDPECPLTVTDCLAKAQFPDRVFVGVCEQNEASDTACPESEPHVRVMRLAASEARGPIWARAQIEQNLYRGERYYLTIDSHTLFAPHWDTECLRQLALCDSPKPILTCYPAEFNRATRQVPSLAIPPSFLKLRRFHPRLGFPETDPLRFREFPTRPPSSLFWAAGFSFARADLIREVPFDPHAQYVFLGEEISMAARFYTWGWDLFAPMSNIVFHCTFREYRPVFWEQFYKRGGKCKVDPETRARRKALERAGNARLARLLRGEPVEIPSASHSDSHSIDDDAAQPAESEIAAATKDPRDYGLGKARTLRDFEEYVGLDLTNRKFKRHATLGLTRHATDEERRVKLGVHVSGGGGGGAGVGAAR